MRTWLLDTGPLVAYLDRADPTHDTTSEAVDGFAGQLVTTSAVITEAMHLVAGAADGPMLLTDFVQASHIRVFESTQPNQLLLAGELMRKYASTPMDFADATLVLLADEVGALEILTLDRRGFSAYRTAKGKRFRLVL